MIEKQCGQLRATEGEVFLVDGRRWVPGGFGMPPGSLERMSGAISVVILESSGG